MQRNKKGRSGVGSTTKRQTKNNYLNNIKNGGKVKDGIHKANQRRD